jgi:hypothetical protein
LIKSTAASSGADTGNQILAQTRAMETIQEWLMDPLISSWATGVDMPINAISWADWWIQASGTWVAGQSMRNMWVLNMDYSAMWEEVITKNITRAIPIPIGINTFGQPMKSSKSKTKKQTQGLKRQRS